MALKVSPKVITQKTHETMFGGMPLFLGSPSKSMSIFKPASKKNSEPTKGEEPKAVPPKPEDAKKFMKKYQL